MASLDSGLPLDSSLDLSGASRYVEIKGVIEIRRESDDGAQFDPVDMFDFQKACPEIPEDYCYKDYATGQQDFFYCLVCQCPIKAVKSLEAHIRGKKHIKRAMDKKREDIIGIMPPPVNMPKMKERKRASRPLGRPDPRDKLVDKLRESTEPVLGLEFITEYLPPTSRTHRMYTCDLEGCKSAWGSAEDMFNHVKNAKHHKNALRRLHPEDSRIAGMNSREVLAMAEQEEERAGGPDRREYDLIVQEKDQRKYYEIYERPASWSAKKAKLSEDLGIPMEESGNANHVPLGSKGSSSSSRSSRPASYSGVSSLFGSTAGKSRKWDSAPSPGDRLIDCLRDMLMSISDDMDLLETDAAAGRASGEDQSRIARRIPDVVTLCLSLETRGINRPGLSELVSAAEKRVTTAEGVLSQPALGLLRFRCEYARLEMAAVKASSSKMTSMVATPEDLETRVDEISRQLKTLGVRKGEREAVMETAERQEMAAGIEDIRRQLERVRMKGEEGCGNGKKAKREENSKVVPMEVVNVDSDDEEVTKEEAVDRFTTEVQDYILTLFPSHGKQASGDGKALALARSYARKITRGESGLHQKKGRAWKDFRLNDVIRKTVAAYVEKKMKL